MAVKTVWARLWLAIVLCTKYGQHLYTRMLRSPYLVQFVTIWLCTVNTTTPLIDLKLVIYAVPYRNNFYTFLDLTRYYRNTWHVWLSKHEEVRKEMKTTIYWIRGLFFALTSFCVCGDGKQYTLNVPRVLLPFVPTAGTKSNFTLTSEHGCFSW